MIPILDLRAQYDTLRGEIAAALQTVLDSGQFVLGPDVRTLEEEVARYCACDHGIGVASGTDALRLSLAALDIGPGDEVITTPFTFVATANTISRSGARPVFVDIEPDTYNIDPQAVAAAITPRTRAIVPVHLYGHPADMGPILGLAERFGLAVIEDAAQAIGASYRGRPVGSLGTCGCLSFYPTKNLGAYGDAGMVVTNDSALAQRIDRLRRHGGHTNYHHEVVGFNSRLDTLQAAVLRVKLRYLEQWQESRRHIAQRYNRMLASLPLVRPIERAGVRHVYHQYTIRVSRRDELAAFLKGRGVGSMIYYPLPLHRQALYAELGIGPGSLPHSEAASREVLSLPMFPELSPEQQDVVVAAVVDFFDSTLEAV